MKRIRRLGLSVLAVFALWTIGATRAMAEEGGNPTILPTPNPSIPFTVESDKATELVTGTGSLTCQKATAEGEFTSQRLGTIKIDFSGCKIGSSACTGTGEAKEVILVNAGIHLVDVLPTGTLDLGLWLEPKEGTENKITFKCGIVGVTVKGSVIGVVDNEKGELLKDLEKGKHFIILWKATGAKQEIKTCDLTKEFCEGRKFELKTNLGFGEEEAAEVTDVLVLFAKEVEFHF